MTLSVCVLFHPPKDWRHFSKGLAEAGHTVLVFDNRGIGSSVCPRGESFTMQDMADDCLSLVRGLGWSSVNLMGISMGKRRSRLQHLTRALATERS